MMQNIPTRCYILFTPDRRTNIFNIHYIYFFVAERPNFKPHPVIANVSIDNSNNISGIMKAKCTFPDDVLNPGILLFEVTWIFDNVFGYTTETVSYNDIQKTDIILNKKNIKTLGRTVNLYFIFYFW